jgi:hypothetical protein
MSTCPPLIAGLVEKHNAGGGYDERLRIGWDFAGHHLIQQGATLTGIPQVSVDPVEGCQDGLLTVEGGSATIADTRVLCWVTGGTPQETYVLRCAVQFSDGHRLVEPVSLDLFRLSPRLATPPSRTSATLVASVLGGNYDGGTPLGPFIDSASVLIDQMLECAAAQGIVHTPRELELIERWLAAWAYTQMDPLYTSRSTADASGSFAERDYQQMAIALDKSGCLADLLIPPAAGGPAGKVTVGGAWLGTPGRCAH